MEKREIERERTKKEGVKKKQRTEEEIKWGGKVGVGREMESDGLK